MLRHHSRRGSGRALITLTVVAIVIAVACRPMTPESRERGPTTVEPSGSPTEVGPSPEAQGGLGDVKLVPVASVRSAVALAVTPLDPAMYIASRGGRVYRVKEDSARPRVVLDLSSEVSCCGGEQGMFDMAFSSEGSTMYVTFTDARGALHVTEFDASGEGPDPESRRELLVVEQLSDRHHGGSLAYGPDGYLYIGLGDSSGGFDPTDEAQSLDSLLGKLLRIDPRPSGDRPYGIPDSNPFVGQRGVRPEIFASGLRNPWRISFDPVTGDLWLGDVGQYEVEEIDVLAEGDGGANFGWNRLEGSRRLEGAIPKDHVSPIAEYSHDEGRCAVIGGFVYRGSLIPALTGAYVYGDLCDGRVRVLVRQDQGAVRSRELPVQLDALASFGRDAEGELYLLSLYRGIYRLEPTEVR